MRLPSHIEPREVLGLMVEQARNAILLIGPGRRALYANRCFLELTGYSYEEFIALERTSAITAPHDQQDTTTSLNDALRGVRTSFRLRPLVRKDGSELWVEGALTPISVAGERFLLAEFRPPHGPAPDGGASWSSADQ